MVCTTRARSWPSTVEALQICEWTLTRFLSVVVFWVLMLLCFIRSNACRTTFDEMRCAFSKTYERTEKIKSLWASALDEGEMELGTMPSLSANLPYPLRPSASRTRSHEGHADMPMSLQRILSYNSESYPPARSDKSSSEDPSTRSATMYATGLVRESGLSSGSTHRNRGSLAQSLNAVLKLEDGSPEGGVWAVPPSTSTSGLL
jgi:hypothetical protein